MSNNINTNKSKEGAPDNINATIFNMGPQLGYYLTITDVPESLMLGSKNLKKSRPKVIMILDRSGSMGRHSHNIATQAFPGSLIELGYLPSDVIHLITFDTVTECSHLRVDKLPSINAHSRGSTNMSPVMDKLKKIFASDPTGDYNIVVISDGGVWDKDLAIRNARIIASQIGNRASAINAVLIRFGAAGDTQAIASIGQFANQGNVPVIDIHQPSRPSDDAVALVNLKMAIVDGFKNSTGSSIPLTGASFIRVPGQQSLNSVNISVGQSYSVLVDPTSNLNNIRLGNHNLNITEVSQTDITENDFSTLISFVENQLKMWIIVGDRTNDIQKVVSFMSRLNDLLTRIKNTTQDNIEISNRSRDRAKALTKLIKSQTKTGIQRILEMGNQSNVARLNNMNSTQQANFLRGNLDVTSKSARNLARRVFKNANGQEIDLNEMANNGLKSLRNQLNMNESQSISESFNRMQIDPFPMQIDPSNPSPDDPKIRSFFSLDTTTDSINAGLELPIGAVTADQVVTIVGGLGIAFRAHRGNYVDPWNFRILELYMGDTNYLLESDIWSVFQDNGRFLECPGRPHGNNQITGVLALRSQGSIPRPLAEIHASISMRGMIAPIPGDRLAMNAAAILWIAHSIGPSKPTELHLRTLKEIIFNIRPALLLLDETSDGLSQDVPRAYMSGDRNFNFLKGFLTLCVRPDMKNFTNKTTVWRALFEFLSYHVVRRYVRNKVGNYNENHPNAHISEDYFRIPIINRILSITNDEIATNPNRTPLSPVFETEMEGDNLKHYDQFDYNNALNEFSKNDLLKDILGDINEIISCFRMVVNLQRPNNNYNYNWQVPSIDSILGVENFKTYSLALAIQLLQCKGQSDIIDTNTRTMITPSLHTNAAATEFLQSVVRTAYAADYSERLDIKRAKEANLRLIKLINDLCTTDNIQEFIRMLNEGILNRQAKGWDYFTDTTGTIIQGLSTRIIDLNDTSIKMRWQKTWIITLSRYGNDNNIIWCNGNVWRPPKIIWDTIEKIMFIQDDTGRTFKQMRKIFKKFACHKYRSNMLNRHNHGNYFPSYWALSGGKCHQLDDWKKIADPTEYEDYVRKHRANGCCGLN